jgi:hypothetical protein
MEANMTRASTLNTAKAKVLKKYPKAYAKEGIMSGDWYVFQGNYGHPPLASGTTAQQAWKRAAESL